MKWLILRKIQNLEKKTHFEKHFLVIFVKYVNPKMQAGNLYNVILHEGGLAGYLYTLQTCYYPESSQTGRFPGISPLLTWSFLMCKKGVL